MDGPGSDPGHPAGPSGPLVLLDSGNFATSDLNDLYRRIINRNTTGSKSWSTSMPPRSSSATKSGCFSRRLTQLFDNNRCKRPVLGSSNRPPQVAHRHDQREAGAVPARTCSASGSTTRPGRSSWLGQTSGSTSAACRRRPRWNCSSRSSSVASANWATPTRSSRPRRCLRRKVEEVWDILEEVIHNHPGPPEPRADAAPDGYPGVRAGAGGRQCDPDSPVGLQGLQRRLRRRPDGRPPAALDRGAGGRR